MARLYDVIIVGGGHNGLVAAGYLAKAGWDAWLARFGKTLGPWREEISAPVVITTAHPAISFLRLVDRAALPPDFDPQVHGGTIVLSESLDEVIAPGFTNSLLHREVIGPYEMEHEYGLVGGNIFHGELTPGQMFHFRPAAGFADLRTPIRGLYQAGSATHGGGGVTGIPGRNVVRQVQRGWRRSQQWITTRRSRRHGRA